MQASTTARGGAHAGAGGAVRVVLEMAGIKNAFGKQLGSGNPLNNARATIEGLRAQRTLPQVAAERGLTVQELMGFTPGALCLPPVYHSEHVDVGRVPAGQPMDESENESERIVWLYEHL